MSWEVRGQGFCLVLTNKQNYKVTGLPVTELSAEGSTLRRWMNPGLQHMTHDSRIQNKTTRHTKKWENVTHNSRKKQSKGTENEIV